MFWNLCVVPAAAAAATVVDGCFAADAAAVGTAAAVTNERSRHVERSGALYVLTVDSK